MQGRQELRERRPTDNVAFVKISTACQNAATNPSKQSLELLLLVLKSYSPSVIEENQIRIFLTLLQILSKETNGSEVKLRCVEALENVVEKAPVVADFFILRSIIQQLIQLVFDPSQSTIVKNIPEELHLKSLNVMVALLKNMTAAHQEKLYSSQAAPFLGVLVCLCLEEAAKQQFKKIKVAAIECLMACGQVLEKPPDESELQSRTASIFMNFVPGVVKGLQQVICADEKQGHAVVVVAVRAWGRMIAQVMDNPAVSNESPDEKPKSLSSASNILEMQETIAKNQRNSAFFKMADQWMQGNVEAVCQAQNHSHHQVRLELILSAQLLLAKCSKNLPSCVVPLLEVLVTLSEDEVPEVSSAACKALEDVSIIFDSDTSLVEILEGNLFRVAENLPSAFTRKDEMCQLSSLCLLVGYLRLLGPRLGEALLLHCQVVLSSLIFVSTFESSHVVLFDDVSLKVELTGFEKCSWHQHKYFSSQRVDLLLNKACKLLAAEAQIVLPQLLTTAVDKPTAQKEAVHLTNLILKNTDDFDLCKSVVQNYLDPSIWDVSLEVDGDVSLAEARSNSVLACLRCEGIAIAICAAGSKAQRLLSLVLYPVLERAGSTVEIVSLAGRLALTSIAKSFGHQSTASLICKEAEYFTHQVAVRLRRPKENPGALLVLCAVLKHGSQDILPSIELIVNQVLKRCDDNRFLPNYIEVFLALITNISQRQDDCMEVEAPDPKKNIQCQQLQSSVVVEELLLHHKINNCLLNEEFDDLNVEDVEVEVPQTDEEPKPPPIHVKMAEAVILRCMHMLPSKDKHIQILTLRVLKKGLPILAAYENQLLPIVHRLWSPLVQRFSPSQDVVVLRHSFELLCIAASLSKSFIRHRCLEQVLPSVCQFLHKQAAVTLKQRGTSYSQTFKLQKTALDLLGPLSLDLELQEEDAHLILQSCCPYLHADQPPSLQESCKHLFVYMTKVNCDAVWLRLNSLWHEGNEIQPPSPLCAIIKLPLLDQQSLKYKVNVQNLIQSL